MIGVLREVLTRRRFLRHAATVAAAAAVPPLRPKKRSLYQATYPSTY